MYSFYSASHDATIYLIQPDQNTGRDEILEISKTFIGILRDVSHPLIKFNIAEISSSIQTGEITGSSADLILRETESTEIPINYEIFLHPISQSWDMGIGTKYDEISTEHVTWKTRKSDINWLSGSVYNTANTTGSDILDLNNDTTDSIGSYITGSGGVWYTTYSVSQSLEYQSSDLILNVLAPVNAWLNSDIENNGWILKLSNVIESNNVDYGRLQYFSKETNTIYQPKLRIGWDDSAFNTGSLSALTSDDIKITFKRLKTEYKVDSKPKIRVVGREKYPLKTYASQYSYTDIKYLPTSSYYQIKDAISDDIIIPFSNYSKLSCDSSGNYFNLNLKNWETNRDYFIEIKTERSGVIEYFTDANLTFTVGK